MSELLTENTKTEELKKEGTPFRYRFFYTVIIALFAALLIKSFFFEAYKIPTGSMENTLLPGDFIIVNKASYSLTTPWFIPLTGIKIPYIRIFNWGTPEINDVIVFGYPGNKNELTPPQQINYIKRVAGTPGDIIEIKNKVLYLNNENVPVPASIRIDTTVSKGEAEKRIYPDNNGWNSDNYGPLYIPYKGLTIEINTRTIDNWKTVIDREYGKRVVSVEGTVVTIDGLPVRRYTFKKNYYFVLGDNRDDSMDSRYWGFVPEDLIIGEAVLIYWSWDSSRIGDGIKNLLAAIRFDRILTRIN